MNVTDHNVPSPARRRSVVPLIGFPVLFTAAYLSLLVLGGKTTGPIEPIYRSIGLFAGNSSWAFEADKEVNPVFKTIAVLAPLLTALGITELVTGAIGPLIVRLLSWIGRWTWQRNRTRVAIFGLNDQSLTFAEGLRRSRRYVPLIYAVDSDERLSERAIRHWIPISGRRDIGSSADRPSTGTVKPICLPSGFRDVVSFLPTADAQVDLATRLRRRSHAGQLEPLRVRLLMANRGLAQRLDEYLRYTNHENDVFPRLIDRHALAAQALLSKHPFDTLADAFDQECIHLAIWGLGALGRAVVKQAAQLYVTRASLGNVQIRFSIIDRDENVLNTLLAENPGITDIIQITAVQKAIIASAGLSQEDLLTLVPDRVTGHIITFDDQQVGFALAVSLRRWLLEPPPEAKEWSHTHRIAPMFVRTPNWTGLGRLIRSGVDHAERQDAELPDGIFPFAVETALLSPETILSETREHAAFTVHEQYHGKLERTALSGATSAETRPAQVEWEALQPQFRESNFQVVDHLSIKARAVGYRLVRADGQASLTSPLTDSVVLDTLAQLEHRRFLAERITGGWRYAAARCDAIRVHPDLVSWDLLPKQEQMLDQAQVTALPCIAGAMGERFIEALIIGITGHREGHQNVNAVHVRNQLQHKLQQLQLSNPNRALLVLTALASGSDMWAAEAACDLRIPFIVPLPLPFELYREDFNEAQEAQFERLVARAEYYFELPLCFGQASELTIAHNATREANAIRRARQYALSGAYITERAHVMIGIWDGQPPDGAGGTGEVLSWNGTVPIDYRTRQLFRPPVQQREQIIVSPRP